MAESTAVQVRDQNLMDGSDSNQETMEENKTAMGNTVASQTKVETEKAFQESESTPKASIKENETFTEHVGDNQASTEKNVGENPVFIENVADNQASTENVSETMVLKKSVVLKFLENIRCNVKPLELEKKWDLHNMYTDSNLNNIFVYAVGFEDNLPFNNDVDNLPFDELPLPNLPYIIYMYNIQLGDQQVPGHNLPLFEYNHYNVQLREQEVANNIEEGDQDLPVDELELHDPDLPAVDLELLDPDLPAADLESHDPDLPDIDPGFKSLDP